MKQVILLLSCLVVSGRYVDVLRDFKTSAALKQQERDDLPDDIHEDFFTQVLDHFRPSDTRSFQQRFFYSDRFFRDGRYPIFNFVCVGGEGPPLDKSVLWDSPHCTGDMLYSAASLLNVSIAVWSLEHRFYGESYPFNTTTNDQLQYLSSRQALGDLAHFAKTHIQQQHDGPIILFGGSYPGVLAALARAKYPFVFAAAVSNSAPMENILDFEGYKNHEAENWDEECRHIVETGHARLVHMVQDELNWETLAGLFGLCDANALAQHRNIEMWLGDGVVNFDTQSNDPNCQEEYCTIQAKCDGLSNFYQEALVSYSPEMATVHSLAKLTRIQQQDPDDCTELNWEDFVTTVSDPEQSVGWRSWGWQTCTEVGFYQTCKGNCPYGRYFHLLDQDLELCERAWGVTNVAENVQKNNEWTGGFAFNQDHVLSMIGAVDPWSEQAVADAILIPEASHHFWTHKCQDQDGAHVAWARERIRGQVSDWIDELTKSRTGEAIAAAI